MLFKRNLQLHGNLQFTVSNSCLFVFHQGGAPTAQMASMSLQAVGLILSLNGKKRMKPRQCMVYMLLFYPALYMYLFVCYLKQIVNYQRLKFEPSVT